MTTTSLKTAPLPLLVLAGVLGAGGCLTPKGDLGEYIDTDGTGGDTTGAPDSDGTTTAPATDSGGPDTTGGSTGADTGDGPGCADPDATESFTIVFDPPLQQEGDFIADCLVSDGDGSHVLQCGAQKVELSLVLDHQPTPPFKAGDTVELHYIVNQSFYNTEWFTIRDPDDQSLLLAGINADKISPDDGVFLFDPVIIDYDDGVCAAPTSCTRPYQHVVVKAQTEQEVVAVMPGESAQVGVSKLFDVSVGEARKYTSEFDDGQGGTCSISDLPPFWFHVLVRPVP